VATVGEADLDRERRRADPVVGPLEFTVLAFEGDRCPLAQLRVLEDAHTRNIVRVIDLLVVHRAANGRVEVRDVSELSDDELAVLGAVDLSGQSERRGWFALDDLDIVTEQLPVSTSAVVVLLEHVWAARLRSAVVEAGGFVVIDGRVPGPLADEVEDVLASVTGEG
jgi:Family of unknown function (DUF6325)